MLRNPTLRVLPVLLVLLAYAAPSEAILGTRRRTAFVAYHAGAAHGAEAAQQQTAQQQAAAQQQQAAQQSAEAQQQAAEASQAAADSAAAASEAAAAAAQAASQPAAAPQTTQQKLQELKALYDQQLISEADYEAKKKEILDEM